MCQPVLNHAHLRAENTGRNTEGLYIALHLP